VMGLNKVLLGGSDGSGQVGGGVELMRGRIGRLGDFASVKCSDSEGSSKMPLGHDMPRSLG